MDLQTPPNDTTPQAPNNEGSRSVFGVAIASMIFTSLFIALRVLGRRRKKIALAAEDYVILAAWFCCLVSASLDLVQVLDAGLARPADQVYPGRIVLLGKVLLGVQIAFALSVGLSKISICLFYVRIFENRRFTILAFVVLAFCAMWCLAAVLVPLLQCIPIQTNWDPSAGSCGNRVAAFVVIAVIDILTDLCILILPIPSILKLQMPWPSRIGLLVLFSMGILTMIISALRVVNLARVDYANVTGSTTFSFLWSQIEPTVGIMIACAPMIRSLFGTFFSSGVSRGNASKPSLGTGDRKNFNRMDDGNIALVDLNGKRISQRVVSPLGGDIIDSGSNESIQYPGAIKPLPEVKVGTAPGSSSSAV